MLAGYICATLLTLRRLPLHVAPKLLDDRTKGSTDNSKVSNGLATLVRSNQSKKKYKKLGDYKLDTMDERGGPVPYGVETSHDVDIEGVKKDGMTTMREDVRVGGCDGDS